MASTIGNKLGDLANRVDYSVLNKPKTTRKYIFWITFFLGAAVGTYFVYKEYKEDQKKSKETRKSTYVFVMHFFLLLAGSFLIAYITGFFTELFGTMNLKQAVLMCKKYGFEEGSPEFQKCLLDEQRARETRQMIAASYYRR